MAQSTFEGTPKIQALTVSSTVCIPPVNPSEPPAGVIVTAITFIPAPAADAYIEAKFVSMVAAVSKPKTSLIPPHTIT
jgi:hypothetical protein